MSKAADKTPGGDAPAGPTASARAECEAVRKRMPLVLVVSGGLLLLALVVAWLQSASYRHPAALALGGASAAPAATLRRAILVCTLDAGRSRNPAADTGSVLMTFDTNRACANGHTLFDREAAGFTRTALTGSGRRVSVLRLSKDLRRFERSDFFIERADFLRLRSVRLRQRLAICGRSAAPGADAAALAALRQTAGALDPLIRRPPDRLMSWSCSAQQLDRAGGLAGRSASLPRY